MRRKIHQANSRGSGIDVSRVFSRESGRPTGRKLGLKLQEAIDTWQSYESQFFVEVNSNCFAFKLHNLGFDEDWKLELIVQRKQLCVFTLNGVDAALDKTRIVGYLVLFVQNPTIHYYTFFAAFSYSGKDDIGAKVPRLLYQDKHLYIFKIGIGNIDYYLGYRSKLREHSIAGTSSGSMHLDTAEAWRDGM